MNENIPYEYRSSEASVRLSNKTWQELGKEAKAKGFRSRNAYIRHILETRKKKQ